jgi:hypothetical protein
MGLIRKTMSATTFGAVKYTSRREAQTEAALAEARLANAQAAQIKQQDGEHEHEHDDRPWWRQPTVGAALRARRPR